MRPIPAFALAVAAIVVTGSLREPITVRAAAQTRVAESKPVSVAATIEAINPVNRTVTLKGPKGNSVEVKVPDEMEGFDTLKVGDQVTATYYDALAVRVRKPGDPDRSADATNTVRKERTPGSETRRELTFNVTVEAIDPAAPSIRVKGPEGRVVTMSVRDPKSLENVKVGDTIEVTYFESLMISVKRPRHP